VPAQRIHHIDQIRLAHHNRQMKPRFDAILPKKVPGAILFKIESYFRHRGEDKVMQIEDNIADTLDQHESAQSSSQQDDDKKP
jgi:hypothetical protein